LSHRFLLLVARQTGTLKTNYRDRRGAVDSNCFADRTRAALAISRLPVLVGMANVLVGIAGLAFYWVLLVKWMLRIDIFRDWCRHITPPQLRRAITGR
jgi:hypothetical protein